MDPIRIPDHQISPKDQRVVVTVMLPKIWSLIYTQMSLMQRPTPPTLHARKEPSQKKKKT
jgi:hypothetical protein